MLSRIFVDRKARILTLIAAFTLLAVLSVNLPRQVLQVSLDHAKEVRVIGDEDNIMLKAPVGAVVFDGKVYVADGGAGKVKVFSDEGVELFEFQGGRFHDRKGAKLDYPSAITLSPIGTLYVADLKGKIVEFDTNGKALRVIKVPRVGKLPAKPLSLAFDILGHLYVGEGQTGRIMVFSNGKFLREFGRGTVDHPGGIVLDRQRRIFVADSNNQRILIFNQLGRPEREWRIEDKLSFVPRGLAFDARGQLVVADTLNSRILVLDQKGRRIKQIMTLSNMDALFLPSSVFIDDMNHLIIADRGLGQVFIMKI